MVCKQFYRCLSLLLFLVKRPSLKFTFGLVLTTVLTESLRVRHWLLHVHVHLHVNSFMLHSLVFVSLPTVTSRSRSSRFMGVVHPRPDSWRTAFLCPYSSASRRKVVNEVHPSEAPSWGSGKREVNAIKISRPQNSKRQKPPSLTMCHGMRHTQRQVRKGEGQYFYESQTCSWR